MDAARLARLFLALPSLAIAGPALAKPLPAGARPPLLTKRLFAESSPTGPRAQIFTTPITPLVGAFEARPAAREDRRAPTGCSAKGQISSASDRHRQAEPGPATAHPRSRGRLLADGVRLHVSRSDSLGTDDVVLAGIHLQTGAAPFLRISAARTRITNDIHLGSASDPSSTPGTLQISGGAQLLGDIHIHPVLAPPQDSPISGASVWIGGYEADGSAGSGSFTGTLHARGRGSVLIYAQGDFAGAITVFERSDLLIELRGGGKISAPLALGAGTTLLLNGGFGESHDLVETNGHLDRVLVGGIQADLVLGPEARVISHRPVVIGRGAKVTIQGALFDVAASFGPPDAWPVSKLKGFDRLVLVSDCSSPDWGTLQGSFRTMNDLRGYTVRFEYREHAAQTALWAVLTPSFAKAEEAAGHTSLAPTERAPGSVLAATTSPCRP